MILISFYGLSQKLQNLWKPINKNVWWTNELYIPNNNTECIDDKKYTLINDSIMLVKYSLKKGKFKEDVEILYKKIKN